jgi:LPXTG-motif cell wall-anchored protein
MLQKGEGRMRIPRVLALSAMTLLMSVGVASAAHAADYPPTTAQQTLGSTVATSTAPADQHAAATTDPDALPFTGSDSASLAWLGVAAVGVGTFATWRFRRRPRVS